MATKRMTVEMDKPFVWPAEYTEEQLEEWHKTTYEKADKAQEEWSKQYGQTKDTYKNPTQREKLREQAQKLLSGQQKWKSSGGEAQQFYLKGEQKPL